MVRTRPPKNEDNHDKNIHGAFASTTIMKKRVRSTERVSSVTRKNDDLSGETIVDSRVSESVIYDIALFHTIEEIDLVEVGLANSHTVTAQYKEWIDVISGNHTNITLGNVYFTLELH